MRWFFSIVLALGLVAVGCSSDEGGTYESLNTTSQQSGTTERLIGLSAVNDEVVWASGTGGTYVRTTDGGTTWSASQVPGADSLQFRDVHAVSADTAYLLSMGFGDQARVYKTTDGGASWSQSFTNTNPDAFFDCMDFWDSESGIAFSDAVDGTFVLIMTSDGGQTWNRIPPAVLPSAYEGEGSFASSGTCLITHGDSTAYVGAGVTGPTRVLKTTDRGQSWTSHVTPLESGADVAGIGSIAFRDSLHGAAMGGIMTTENPPDSTIASVALTDDGGETWSLTPASPLPGVFGGTYVPGTTPPILAVVGPEGLSYTADDGASWTRVESQSYWSIDFASPDAGWAVGPDGRITHLSFQ